MELETAAANGIAAGVAELTAAAAQPERTAAALEARFSGTSGGEVPKVVAAVESESSARLAELEMRLQAAEGRIAELKAAEGKHSEVATGLRAHSAATGRKTLPATTAHLLAKQGIDTLDQVNGSALDAALTGLSLEQRIAVKSQLMRAGLLG